MYKLNKNKITAFLITITLLISLFSSFSISTAYATENNESESLVETKIEEEYTQNTDLKLEDTVEEKILEEAESSETVTETETITDYSNKIKEYARKNTWLGREISGINCKLKNNGCVQSFQNGAKTYAVYYSPLTKTTTHVSFNAGITKRWIAMGWENSPLGYPVDIERQVANRHWIQDFEKGVISYSDHGVFISYKGNRITDYYYTHRNRIGHTIRAEKCGLKNGACVQSFEKNGNGYAVYAHPKGVYSVERAHPIIKHWISKGWENSSFGYPMSEMRRINGGFEQDFEKGKIQYINNKIREVVSLSSTLQQYVNQNKNTLGNNLGNIRCGLRNNGCVQSFSKNNQILAAYVSSNTPATHINLSSKIGQSFSALNWENGKYGYPTAVERTISQNKTVQEFEKMVVFSVDNELIENPKNHLITKQYLQNKNTLLYPTKNMKCGLTNNGCVQTFISNTNERIGIYSYSNKAVQVKLDHPNIRLWAKQGWEDSPLGYPVREANGIQYFENGYIQSQNIVITNKQAAFNKYYNLNKNRYGTKIYAGLRCNLVRGGCVATLENNSGAKTAIYITPNNGIVPVILDEPVAKKWIESNWESGKYGYPVETSSCTPSRCEQRFEKGTINVETSVYPPTNSRMNGIDIASWQSRLHLKNIANQVQFVIVKATGGTGYVNPFHKTHADQTIQLGKKIGFYHFAHEVGYKGSAEAEARHFVDTIRPYLKYGPMLVLDNESDNMTDVAWNKKWLDTVYKLTGVKPLIYMSQSTVNQVNWSSVAKADYPLWVAYYPYNAPKEFQKYRTPNFTIKWWNKALMWQYTSNLRLSGYESDLDGNVFYGDNGLWAYYALPR